MEAPPRIFVISFVSLLAAATEKLRWKPPAYMQTDPSQNIASVRIEKGEGPTSYHFCGGLKNTLIESQEEAAEKAIGFLVSKEKVMIDDVNWMKHRDSVACSAFYEGKREEVECCERSRPKVAAKSDRKRGLQMLGRRPKVIGIDFWGLLMQVVVHYKIRATSVESFTPCVGRHVCSIAVKTHKRNEKMEFFMSERYDTVADALQNLGKKVVARLQPIHGFTVKDANYSRLMYAELQCLLQFESLVASRERVFGIQGNAQPLLLPSQLQFHTPTTSEHQIAAPHSPPPPPPPKKPKARSAATAGTSMPHFVSGLLIPECLSDSFQPRR